MPVPARPASRGDGGPAVAAEIAPESLQVDAAGNIWFLTESGTRLRRVDAADGTISTVAGIGESGSDGDGSAATAARIEAIDFAVGPNGDVILLEQDWDSTAQLRLRRVDAGTGIIGPVALG